MSEQEGFDSGSKFVPADIGVPYPDLETIRAVAEDPKVEQGLQVQDDPLLTPAEKRNAAGDLEKFIVSKHRLFPDDAAIALAAYETVRSETRELARTQQALKRRSDALDHVTEYVCGRKVTSPVSRATEAMRKMAHAN